MAVARAGESQNDDKRRQENYRDCQNALRAQLQQTGWAIYVGLQSLRMRCVGACKTVAVAAGAQRQLFGTIGGVEQIAARKTEDETSQPRPEDERLPKIMASVPTASRHSILILLYQLA